MQELESAAAREIARKERERLKQQDKLRREQLEKFRATANMDAAKGEVRSLRDGAFEPVVAKLAQGCQGAVHDPASMALPRQLFHPRSTLALLPQAERGRKRLNFLLKQAEVFQHFAPATVERERKKRGGRHGTGRTEEQEDEELLRDEEGGAEQAGHRLQVRANYGPKCCRLGRAPYEQRGEVAVLRCEASLGNGVIRRVQASAASKGPADASAAACS